VCACEALKFKYDKSIYTYIHVPDEPAFKYINRHTYLHMHQMLVVQNGISILVSHYNLSNDFTSLALHMQKSHLEFLGTCAHAHVSVDVCVCVCERERLKMLHGSVIPHVF